MDSWWTDADTRGMVFVSIMLASSVLIMGAAWCLWMAWFGKRASMFTPLIFAYYALFAASVLVMGLAANWMPLHMVR